MRPTTLPSDPAGLGELVKAMNQAAFTMLDTDTSSFEASLHEAMGALAAAAKVDRVYIWKNSVENELLVATQVYEWSENASPQQHNDLTVSIPYRDIAPEWEVILSSGGTINSIVRDMDSAVRKHLAAQDVLSILIVPVTMKNRFWGFIGFDDCRTERFFSENVETVLRSGSLLFAHAYDRNILSNEMIQQEELNRVMFESAPIGLTIFDEKQNLIDCNGAVLEMYGNITREHYIESFFDLSPEYQPDGSFSKDKVHEILNRTLNGENLKMEWMHSMPIGESIPCEVTLSSIVAGGRKLVLAYTYDLRQVKKLESELDKAKGKIYIDQLTGIFNRRYFDETLAGIIPLLSRSEAHLSVLMLDIDFFKRYNDRLGHQCGDEALRRVAEILNSNISRSDDFVARYGGEEFVIVLPSTDEVGACLLAENIIASMKNENIPHPESDCASYVTLSIGVASGEVRHTQTAGDYVKLADELLYEAKRNGRNQYRFKKFV